MWGSWIIIDKITDKFYNVKCSICNFETQKLASTIKLHHRCPSIVDGTKYCYKCSERKSLEFFHKDPTVSGGYSKLCRECYSERVNVIKFSHNPVHRKNIKGSNNIINVQSTKISGLEKFLNYRQKTLKYRHRNKTFAPYNLPDGYLVEQFKRQDGKCYYSGYSFDYKAEFFANSISVDRLYPEKGYTIGNVVLCTHSINTMKLNMNVEEFKNHLFTIKDGLEKFICKN